MNYTKTVRIIVVHNKKLLLLEKSNQSRLPGYLEFPGGKVEEIDEKNSDTYSAVRELQEETGIVVKSSDLKKLDYENNYSFKFDDIDADRIVNYYLVQLDYLPEVVTNNKEDKHIGYRWVTMDEYSKLYNESVKIDHAEVGVLSPNSLVEPSIISN